MAAANRWASQVGRLPRHPHEDPPCDPWRGHSQRILCDELPHCQTLLVARYAVWHHLVCKDLPPLPIATNKADPHTTYGSPPCTSVRKNAYGHHASPHLWRFQVHHTGSLHSLPLAGVPMSASRDSTHIEWMDLPRRPLSVGNTLRDSHRQWACICQGLWTIVEEVPC